MPETAVASGNRQAVGESGDSGSLHVLQADLVRVLGETAEGRRQARDIVSLLLDRSPAWISAHDDETVEPRMREGAIAAAWRLRAGAPLAYAVGRAAFRNLVLSIDDRVLIPRPETETVVDEALRVCSRGVAVDVGTGSGALALALATEGCFQRVVAIDVSADALQVAATNVRANPSSCRIELRCGSLLGPLRGERVDLIVSNPPYIAASEMLELPGSVRDWEPGVSLLSGGDGLRHTAALVATAGRHLQPGGWLVLEIDTRRATAVRDMLEARPEFADVAIRPDLTGRPRIALARRSTAAQRENHI